MDDRYKNIEMVLDFFPIKAREGLLDCEYFILNLMQFLKLWPILISIFQSWMLFWIDLLKKSVMNTKPKLDAVLEKSSQSKLILVPVDPSLFCEMVKN